MKIAKHLLPIFCCVFIASAIVYFHFTRIPHISSDGVFVSPSEIDFGLIHNQDFVKKQFTVINGGNSPVEIIDIKFSCGCTKIDIPSRHIPPQKSIVATVEIDLNGNYGHKEFEVILITNHKATPVIRLTLIGTVSTTQLDGTIPFDIGVFAPSDMINESIVIQQKILNPHITLTKAFNNDLEQTTISIEADNNETKLYVRGKAPSQTGTFYLSALLTADGPFWKQTNITITGLVQSPWELDPVIYLGFISPQQQVKKTIKLKREFSHQKFQKQPIKETKIISGNDLLKKKVIYVGTDEIIFELELAHPGYKGLFTDDFEIRFVDTEKEYISRSTIKASFL
jgi:hypothetical protein